MELKEHDATEHSSLVTGKKVWNDEFSQWRPGFSRYIDKLARIVRNAPDIAMDGLQFGGSGEIYYYYYCNFGGRAWRSLCLWPLPQRISLASSPSVASMLPPPTCSEVWRGCCALARLLATELAAAAAAAAAAEISRQAAEEAVSREQASCLPSRSTGRRGPPDYAGPERCVMESLSSGPMRAAVRVEDGPRLSGCLRASTE